MAFIQKFIRFFHKMLSEMFTNAQICRLTDLGISAIV